MSARRPGWRSAPRCWGRRAARRPRRCRSGLRRQRRSHRRGWSGCWCCWVKASRCPRWRWADSKQIAPASESRFSWWESRPCCLGERKAPGYHPQSGTGSVLPNFGSCVTLFSFFWQRAMLPNIGSTECVLMHLSCSPVITRETVIKWNWMCKCLYSTYINCNFVRTAYSTYTLLLTLRFKPYMDERTISTNRLSIFGAPPASTDESPSPPFSLTNSKPNTEIREISYSRFIWIEYAQLLERNCCIVYKNPCWYIPLPKPHGYKHLVSDTTCHLCFIYIQYFVLSKQL